VRSQLRKTGSTTAYSRGIKLARRGPHKTGLNSFGRQRNVFQLGYEIM